MVEKLQKLIAMERVGRTIGNLADLRRAVSTASGASSVVAGAGT